MKKACFGIIASGLFLYFSFSGIEYIDIKNSFANVDYIFLLYSLIFFISNIFLKSIRWGIILSPIEQISQKYLFPITCVGNMAVIIFPFRTGEIVKPYLISNSKSIPLSSAISTVFVERIIDSFFLFLLLIFIFFSLDIPEWYIKAGYSFIISFLILICIGFFFYFNTKLKTKLFKPLFKIISEKLNKKIENVFHDFVQGFQIISELREILLIGFLTILIWISSALAIYSLYYFQGLHLSLESAFIVLSIIAIGISVPSAPGFLGNFQFACVLALSIFNIPKADAVAFGIIYYILGFGGYVLLGLIFVPFTNFPLKIFSKENSPNEIS
jgi:glycosyltransferase 2 family protein